MEKEKIMLKHKGIRSVWRLLKESFEHFSEEDIFTHAAALAYYTIFALPPMLIVVLYFTTLFYEEAAVREAIFTQVGDLVGKDGARQLLSTIDQLGLYDQSWWATLVGIAALLFTSTTVFVTIQNTLNRLFRVRPKPEGWGILKMIRDRLLSFAVLLGIAFVLLVSLVVNALLLAFGNYLSAYFPEVSVVLMTILSIGLSLLVISLLFASIFKYLPDVRLPWRDAMVGGILTALLFSIGKDLIGFYIGNSQTANLYEAAGSIMVIMLWVFYAAVIFLYGAVFTYVYARRQQGRIQPADYAVKFVRKELEESFNQKNNR